MSENGLEEIKRQVKGILDFLELLYGPNILDDHEPPIVKPTEGYIKNDGKGWGANQDPSTWEPVPMRDNPALWKVVDDKGVNVATDFTSKITAQGFIDWHRSTDNDDQPDEPDKPEEPQKPDEPLPTGESITKDGVKVPVKIIAPWNYKVSENWRDGGCRFNMPEAGTSLVMVGYFTSTGDTGDEISPKNLMGRHTDDKGKNEHYMGCGYDGGIRVAGGKPRLRVECPHNNYSSALKNFIKSEPALSMVGKWRGYMSIIQQEEKGVRIRYFQDVGDCETKPANDWKLIYEYFDDGSEVGQINDSDLDLEMFPIRTLEHTKGTAQNVWRCDETPGLKAKWLGVAPIAGKNQ